MSGREPAFLLGRLECTADRLRSGSLCVDLEKIRGAAERVARSEGLEIVDVEWKVGKQRFLRVYIDRIPKPAAAISDAAGHLGGEEAGSDPYPKISHANCQGVSRQLSVILAVEDRIPGPAGKPRKGRRGGGELAGKEKAEKRGGRTLGTRNGEFGLPTDRNVEPREAHRDGSSGVGNRRRDGGGGAKVL